jgi:hypothetical protein
MRQRELQLYHHRDKKLEEQLHQSRYKLIDNRLLHLEQIRQSLERGYQDLGQEEEGETDLCREHHKVLAVQVYQSQCTTQEVINPDYSH